MAMQCWKVFSLNGFAFIQTHSSLKTRQNLRSWEIPGGKSRGISVYFVDDYVENDEVTFENGQLEYHDNRPNTVLPITLEKIQMSDGKWAFWGESVGCFVSASGQSKPKL